jgi:hypothetical protein
VGYSGTIEAFKNILKWPAQSGASSTPDAVPEPHGVKVNNTFFPYCTKLSGITFLESNASTA